jgi:hypothetical protein
LGLPTVDIDETVQYKGLGQNVSVPFIPPPRQRGSQRPI